MFCNKGNLLSEDSAATVLGTTAAAAAALTAVAGCIGVRWGVGGRGRGKGVRRQTDRQG